MIVEMILTALVAFSFGSYAGKQVGVKEEKARAVIPAERAPDVWPPVSHERLLKACAIACGEYKFREYNVIYGKCLCKE